MHANVHCSTIYNSQDTEATYMSINQGICKDGVAHIYKEHMDAKGETLGWTGRLGLTYIHYYV